MATQGAEGCSDLGRGQGTEKARRPSQCRVGISLPTGRNPCSCPHLAPEPPGSTSQSPGVSRHVLTPQPRGPCQFHLLSPEPLLPHPPAVQSLCAGRPRCPPGLGSRAQPQGGFCRPSPHGDPATSGVCLAPSPPRPRALPEAPAPARVQGRATRGLGRRLSPWEEGAGLTSLHVWLHTVTAAASSCCRVVTASPMVVLRKSTV